MRRVQRGRSMAPGRAERAGFLEPAVHVPGAFTVLLRTPVRARRVPVAMTLLLTAALSGPVHAQDAAGLRAPAMALRQAWAGADLEALADLLDPRGVRLSTPSASHPMLTRRQMTSALESLFEASGRGPADVRRMEVLGGEPMRAFAVLEWRPKPPGVSESLERTVYVGFERTPEGWRVVEIRILTDP